MSVTTMYKCVNCGEPTLALYRTYGPSVLKLNKCEKCKGFVDKYIEYDPVIVMIDLVLISKEAQRHVIYNTDFKSYWKLFIILTLLETYGVWRRDSLFNIAVDSLCDTQTNGTVNYTYLALPGVSMPELASWRHACAGWAPDQRADDSDLFIWEKDFYIQFTSTFAGIVIFILTVHSMMKLMKSLSLQSEASLARVVKAFSLANVSSLLSLPMLVWGSEGTEGAEGAAAHTRAVHYSLVFAYSFVVFLNVFTVVYECPAALTALVLVASSSAKHLATFHLTPYLRGIVS